jgi:nucleoside-diphosphate-sugar epimerase
MRILVTGGSGYIGTMLVKKLLIKNYKVLSIDKKIFGDRLIKHKNLKNL